MVSINKHTNTVKILFEALASIRIITFKGDWDGPLLEATEKSQAPIYR